MTTDRTTALRLRLDYDFNSPPDRDGHYHVLAHGFLTDVPRVGDDVLLDDGEALTRPGRVVSQYRILLVEPTGKFDDH